MKAEEKAEYLRHQLKSDWPVLNHCDGLEVLTDSPIQPLKPFIPPKLSFWRKLWNKLKGIFHGKQNSK